MAQSDPIDFIHDLTWQSAPQTVRDQIKLGLLDLIGIAAAGTQTRLSQIIRDHAVQTYGGTSPIMFDTRTASPAGCALAIGMTIDAIDGHDGFNPSKGHIGCPMMPAALAIAHRTNATGEQFLTAMLLGYEFGARAAIAQHATVPDYHTSGSWGAVTAAATCARLLNLSRNQTRHAVGIAEYHGPRSQMMRCIDHPTMVKDGSGWGAMTGLSAADLAQSGFTGAPAITVEHAPEFWSDLGARWYTMEQYYKPYPVCRWAQAPVEAAMLLCDKHNLKSRDITGIKIATFHESIRLATAAPRTTEEAQYSTSFPVAVAIVRGAITPADLDGDALNDPEILRLSHATHMVEDDTANRLFPNTRQATLTLTLTDGQTLTSPTMTPKWDATDPPTPAELRAKFHTLADPLMGPDRANRIKDAIETLDHAPLDTLTKDLFQPLNC